MKTSYEASSWINKIGNFTPYCPPPLPHRNLFMQENLALSISDGIQFVPTDWDVSHTESHWINKASLLQHFAKVIVPYVNEIQNEVLLDTDRINQKSVTIFDIFAAHHTCVFLNCKDKNNIQLLFVPAAGTDKLLPWMWP